jgi:hypothetical protein
MAGEQTCHPRIHRPWSCHWMDVTLYLDDGNRLGGDWGAMMGTTAGTTAETRAEAGSGKKAAPMSCWWRSQAVMFRRRHTSHHAAALNLQITCVKRTLLEERGKWRLPASCSRRSANALFRSFTARSLTEVQRWWASQDAPEVSGLWLHVWNPRCLGRMVTCTEPWRFTPYAHALFQVQPVSSHNSLQETST